MSRFLTINSAAEYAGAKLYQKELGETGGDASVVDESIAKWEEKHPAHTIEAVPPVYEEAPVEGSGEAGEGEVGEGEGEPDPSVDDEDAPEGESEAQKTEREARNLRKRQENTKRYQADRTKKSTAKKKAYR